MTHDTPRSDAAACWALPSPLGCRRFRGTRPLPKPPTTLDPRRRYSNLTRHCSLR